MRFPTPLSHILAFVIGTTTVAAQGPTVQFKEPKGEFTRSSTLAQLRSFEIKATGLAVGKTYVIKAIVDEARTTLAPVDYSLQQPSSNFKATAPEHSLLLYVEIKPDKGTDRERALVLGITVTEDDIDINATNAGTIKTLDLTIKSGSPVETYDYLAYVGTNFDLVDGVKPKNLFFATNIYQPSRNDRKVRVGGYLSLYGNRSVSSIDSLGTTRRLTRIEPVNDTTYRRIYQEAQRVTVFNSDNLGAHLSALIDFTCINGKKASTTVYFAPTMEFIYRRSSVVTTYSNGSVSDTVLVAGMGPTLTLDDRVEQNFNNYEFFTGGGFFIAHENDRISARVQLAIGRSSLYYPTVSSVGSELEQIYTNRVDFSFIGRAWITERVSGITLQAEIINSVKIPRPYYGVTLSKAIDFKNVGNVLKPIGEKN